MDVYAAPMLAQLNGGPHDGETVEAIARSPHHPPLVIERAHKTERVSYILDKLHPITYEDTTPVRHYRWIAT